MNILSFDQASTTGWAYYDNNKIADFGVIVSNKKMTYDARISYIKTEVEKLIQAKKPILVTLEGIQFERNYASYYKLSKLQGVLINYCLENKILFEIIPSTKWRGALDIKGKNKKTKKENAIAYVQKTCNIETNEDTAEAICMALYSAENIKINTLKE